MKKFYIIITAYLLLQVNAFAQHDFTYNRDQLTIFSEQSNGAIVPNLDSLMLDSVIIEYKTGNSIPGITSLIYKDGQVIWDKNYGFKNLQLQTPIDDSTYFQIGSISKTFVATSIMQLWQAGLIDLENDINNYLPSDFQVRNPIYPDDSITVKMLMVHTSSIRTNWDKIDPLITCGDSPIELEDFLVNYLTPGGTYYSSNNYYNYSPGSQWNYTNEGAGLLALIVENLTGKTFNEYCRDSIFIPLSMNSSHWFLSDIDISLIATPYDGTVPRCLQGIPNYPTGFLRMTKSDMSKYLQAYLNYGVYNNHRILDSSTVAFMFSDQLGYYVTLAPLLTYLQGLSWWKTNFIGNTAYGRGGAWNGALAYVGINQAENWFTIFFQNQKPPNSIAGNLIQITIPFLKYARLYGNIYALHPTINKTYVIKNVDPVLFTTQFSNSHNLPFNAMLIYANQDSSIIDSISLFDDGLHGDSLSNDGIYGNHVPAQQDEDFFYLGVNTVDLQSGKYISTPDIQRFTTIGPVILDSIYINKLSDRFFVTPYVKNLSADFTITNASLSLLCNDPGITSISPASKSLPAIPPGGVVHPNSGFYVWVNSTFTDTFNFFVRVNSNGSPYWESTMQIVVGIENDRNLQPLCFNLEQNYPNPFNPSTKIKYSIPQLSMVQIKVYDVLGNEIETLVNEEKPAGTYEITWNAAFGSRRMPSGVYFYQLRAGSYVQTKKMILLR